MTLLEAMNSNLSIEEAVEMHNREKSVPLNFTVMILCYTQIILATISNIIALYALRCEDTSLDEITRLFFKALTIVNLVVGVVYPFTYSFISLDRATDFTRPAQLYNIICRWFQSFFTAPLVLALLIVVCVNLNKYLMISRPLRYHQLVTPSRAKIAIVCAVATAIGYSMLFASFPSSPYARYRTAICNKEDRSLYQIGKRWLLVEIAILTPLLILTTALNVRILRISLKLTKRQVVPRPLRSSPLMRSDTRSSSTATDSTLVTSSLSSSSMTSSYNRSYSPSSPFTPSPPDAFSSSPPPNSNTYSFSQHSPSPFDCPSSSPLIKPGIPDGDQNPLTFQSHPTPCPLQPQHSSSLKHPSDPRFGQHNLTRVLGPLLPRIPPKATPDPCTSLPAPDIILIAPPGVPCKSHSTLSGRQRKTDHHSNHGSSRYHIRRSDRKAIKTIAIITATFYIIWVPLIVYDILNYLQIRMKCFVSAVKLILMASTWWNTFLYIGTDKNVRNHVLRCLMKLFRCKKNK
ncbi:uncharacterized protein LOC135154991 [Lytechinus pictus]|uniref:uncharacterized protein LOC135154991 n=1 Tax=Lytechinus pictus TaxID=7653 RepID=UPI0030BA1B1C